MNYECPFHILGELSDPDVDEGSLPWLVSLTTGFGVIFGLSLIWIASRIQINCRKTQVTTVCHAVNDAGVNGSPASSPSSSVGPAASGRRSLWDWMARQPAETQLPSESHEDTNDSMTTLVSTDPDQDRVALIAYMNQVSLLLQFYISFLSFSLFLSFFSFLKIFFLFWLLSRSRLLRFFIFDKIYFTHIFSTLVSFIKADLVTASFFLKF